MTWPPNLPQSIRAAPNDAIAIVIIYDHYLRIMFNQTANQRRTGLPSSGALFAVWVAVGQLEFDGCTTETSCRIMNAAGAGKMLGLLVFMLFVLVFHGTPR